MVHLFFPSFHKPGFQMANYLLYVKQESESCSLGFAPWDVNGTGVQMGPEGEL